MNTYHVGQTFDPCSLPANVRLHRIWEVVPTNWLPEEVEITSDRLTRVPVEPGALVLVVQDSNTGEGSIEVRWGNPDEPGSILANYCVYKVTE